MITFERQQSQLDRAKSEYLQSNWSAATQILHEVLAANAGALYSKSDSDSILAESHTMLGSIAYYKSEYSLALDHFNQSLEASERLENKLFYAKALRSIGDTYQNLTDYDTAMEYQQRALAIDEEINDLDGITSDLGSLGNLYFYQSDYHLALDYYLRALSIAETQNNSHNIALYLGNIANVYNNLSDYGKSLEYYKQAITIEEKNENTEGIARLLGNIGSLYQALEDCPRAIDYYQRALVLCEKLHDRRGMARNIGSMGLVYQGLADYEKALEYQFRALDISEEIGDRRFVAYWLAGIARVEMDEGQYAAAEPRLLRTLAIRRDELKSNEEVAETLLQLGELYRKQHQNAQALALLNEAMHIAESMDQKVTVARVYGELAEYYAELGDGMMAFEQYKKFHTLEKEVFNETTKKQADKLDHERKQAEREKELAIKHARSQLTDEILANILPPNIMERLIKGEKKIADTHEQVTVLFVDIVGFTQMSAKIPASELIDILDIVFTRFDTICKKHGLEKIKTIGDAYMAVCGAPIAYENHAERAARTALEMLENCAIEQRYSVPVTVNFRIGLHSGSVVAGIIGKNKYAYDLWGDAVNTASRMESHGEAGKIHVSEEFVRNLTPTLSKGEGEEKQVLSLGEDLGEVAVLPRGEMHIKGKGMMKTYYLQKATL